MHRHFFLQILDQTPSLDCSTSQIYSSNSFRLVKLDKIYTRQHYKYKPFPLPTSTKPSIHSSSMQHISAIFLLLVWNSEYRSCLSSISICRHLRAWYFTPWFVYSSSLISASLPPRFSTMVLPRMYCFMYSPRSWAAMQRT